MIKLDKFIMKKVLLSILALFICFNNAFSQDVSEEAKVSSLFPEGDIQWIKYFKGRVDDLSDIRVSLGYDGAYCRGIFTYIRSGETFTLEGQLRKDTLIVNELDANESVTGHLKGVFKGKYFTGEWTNFNNTIGGIQINLQELAEPPVYPSYCGDNKWVHAYRAGFGEDEFEFLLQKGSFGSMRGVGYSKKSKQSFHIKGTYDELQNGMVLALKNQNNEKMGTLSLKMKSINEFTGSYQPTDGAKCFGDALRSDNLGVGCMEYADYVASYDVTYPKKDEDSAFNLWMQTIIADWFKETQKFINDVRMDNIDNVPEIRSVARAYSWCDMDYYSNELISGFMHFGNSWTKNRSERAFIFDLRTGKEIAKQDIFKADSKVDEVIQQYILEQLPKNLLANDEQFVAWINTQTFSNITVRREGLAFSTEANGTYGRQSVIVPLKLLTPYLNPKTSIFRLTKLPSN
jgi:hypothetical protein